MKAFIKKLKRCNKSLLILLVVSLVAYLIGYINITINLVHLTGIETIIRTILIVLFGLWFFIWLIIGLVTLFTKKYARFVIMVIFTILFTTLFGFGSYYIDIIYKQITGMNKETITYSTSLVALNDTEFNESSIIGIINDTSSIEGYQLAKKLIEKENLNDNKLYQYDDFYLMLEALYNKEIDACFLSSNYTVIFASEELYSNIDDETKVLKSYSEEMINEDNVSYTNKSLNEPFTILVMGVDSEIDGLNANAPFNGDTLMLVTFNPKTLTASLFSLPRDLYVPITCRSNKLAKINSSAAYNTACVKSTIKNLTDIDIDYYVKINFKGVVDLVDVLGGVTVDVEKPYFNINHGVNYHGQVCEQNSNREIGKKIVCVDPGVQKLNGEQALAYARNRHQYIGSDLDRIRHQQDVVQAMAESSKDIKSFDEFKNILNAVQKNIDTNMTTDQILSLYNVGKSLLVNTITKGDFNLSINRTYLETYSLNVYLGSSTTSALGYYKSSLDEIVKMMKINLELEKATPNKSFEIDYNENYESSYYGKGSRKNKTVETMANLVGESESYARSWATEHGLNTTVIKVSPSDPNYNSSFGAGIVTNQSIHMNSIITSGSVLTIYVNKESSNQQQTNNNSQVNNNNEEEKNNNDISNITGETQKPTIPEPSEEQNENDSE